MRRKSFLFVSFLFTVLLLFSGGCSHTVERAAGSEDANSLTMKAVFEEENGAPLSGGAVRFSDGESSADYLSDQDGCLYVSGLPAQGELEVSVLDGRGEPRGTVTLIFTRGEVIDAVTDENSIGHVTLKEDTREITLKFTLGGAGALECQLQLPEPRVV